MKTKTSVASNIFAWVFAFISIAPFVYVLTLSFLPASGGITFSYYYDVFLGTSQYLLRFWKSMGICLAIVAGQLVVSVLAGYGFAKCQFKGRDTLLFVLMILMVLPLQVTLAPNYIMLDKLGLLDTYSALIFPSIFVPLGTFIRQAGRLRPVPAADKGDSAHEYQRPGVCHPAVFPGRVEYGGAAHCLHQGFCAVSHLCGPGLCAPC